MTALLHHKDTISLNVMLGIQSSKMFNRPLYSKSSNLIIQLLRYTIVGGLAFIVDYGLLVLLTEIFGFYYVLSATISFTAGLTVNYLISTRWVFGRSSITDKRVEFIAYALVGVIGLILNNVFLYVLTDLLSIDYRISKPLTAVLVYAWNFLARRFLIFNPKSN